MHKVGDEVAVLGLVGAGREDLLELVVLVDQFEEVFTLCNDEAERRDFIANLLHAATAAGGRTIVVLTMRADFYPRCAAYADLAAALSDHQVLVGPMTEDELRRAIDRPARLAGLEPEPGLVELLVDDIRGRAGALPLLQFALQEVWRRREAHRLTIRTYRDDRRDRGGVAAQGRRGLCRLHARAAGALPAGLPATGPAGRGERGHAPAGLAPRAAARRPRAGRGGAGDHRPAGRPRVAAADDRAETAGLGRGDAGGPHEALIRGWPQLRKWIEADRAGLRTHLRLTDAAKEWADADPEAKGGTLYTGARLAVATEWAAANRDLLSPSEKAFLDASKQAEQKQQRKDTMCRLLIGWPPRRFCPRPGLRVRGPEEVS